MEKVSKSNSGLFRQIVNIVAYIVMLAVNILANVVPFNGQMTNQVSDKFPVYFVPAGYVFSIWGVIYLFLLGFTIYQALPSQRNNEQLRRIGYLPALSGLLNSLWVPLWHYEQFPLTMIVMLALLVTLIAIYVRLEIGRVPAPMVSVKWLVNIPFSVYLGWITVASVANATDLLYYLNWDGFGISPLLWGVIMLIAGTVITAGIIATRRDAAYTLVILWAYIGIWVKQSAAPTMANSALASAAILAVLLILSRLTAKPLISVRE
jgi:benzodiazapine receptor